MSALNYCGCAKYIDDKIDRKWEKKICSNTTNEQKHETKWHFIDDAQISNVLFMYCKQLKIE